MTYLSHFATGMRHLEQLLAAIWNQVCSSRMYRLSEDEEVWSIEKDCFHKTVYKLLNLNSEGEIRKSSLNRIKTL